MRSSAREHRVFPTVWALADRKIFAFESACESTTISRYTPRSKALMHHCAARARTAAALSLTAIALSAPAAAACPGMYACVPTMCTDMIRDAARNQTGAGTAVGVQAFNSRNVTLLSQLPLLQMGGLATTDGSSLHAWVDPLTRREYAVMGRSNGTAVIDVTNPVAPVYVANIPPVPLSSNTVWREPKVYKNHAYIGVDGTNHRMQIVDLTQVRNYSGTPMTLGFGTYTGANVTKVHTVGLNS